MRLNDNRSGFPVIPTQLPARLTAPQCAARLGFQPHDIPVLIEARLLKPLGNPRPQAVRYFCTVEIEEFAAKRQWLAKATNAIYEHWNRKNQAADPAIEEDMAGAFAYQKQ